MYSYSFIRLNKFNTADDPVKFLDNFFKYSLSLCKVNSIWLILISWLINLISFIVSLLTISSLLVLWPRKIRKNAIIIPEESVLTDGTQRTVYVINNGVTKATPVKLGQRLTGEVEVTEGIDEDAIVVTGGIQKVRDGSKVTIRETDN